VDLPERRVRVDIFERRTAFLGTLEGFVIRAAEAREVRRVTSRRRKGDNALSWWRRIMAAVERISLST
jgi:hypothetical protein